ncbi:cardiolipin synthase [Paenibacillus wulumuqiensis]|uniref:cardiolipin synthase n=1 Tax=Paenibacillus wulumuqiensis TaxID=1567107 RepID=UPI000619D499|nr:cardiolipin synthase [Paenibacillus wulumuqiensis]
MVDFYAHFSWILLIINLFLALFIVFLERRNVGATWAWLMVLLFIPIAGFLVYLFLGQNLSRVKRFRLRKEFRSIIESVVEDQRIEFKEKKFKFNDPSISRYHELVHLHLISNYSLYTQDNAVRIFADGREKFDALFEDIANAREYIHIQYYIIQKDDLGRRLLKALTAKALEGVTVRLIYDAWGSSNVNKSFLKEFVAAGGHAAAFFPPSIPLINFKVNYRNHRKVVIIDGLVGYVGGFNVGDEYLGLVEKFGYWRDTHLRVEGSAILQMQTHFLRDWHLALNTHMSGDYSLFAVSKPFTGNIGMQIVSSGPDSSLETIKYSYIKMMYEAKESIMIQTPYFIPDESMVTAMKSAILSGVQVHLMIPKKPDHQMVYWASYSYLRELLELDAHCYLYEKGFLHAKTMVIDGKIASVGTANMDIRSYKLNFEINAVIYDSQAAKQLEDLFLKDILDSQILTLTDYNNRPLYQKTVESFARLLSPIL